MKFIHAADLHLDGASAKIKTFYGQKEVSIIEASQKAFVNLVDFSRKEKVDFVVISGDLFDSNWKDYVVGLFFIEQIKRLDCPVYYIKGNHDSENRLLKTLPFPENLKIFKSQHPETFLIEDLGIAIHGQSYRNYHIQEDLAAAYPKKIGGYFNIGLLHTSGSISNGEKPYAPYEERELLKKQYEYWALGHIHTPHLVKTEPHIVYSGTSQGRNAKETGLKGCYLVEVENNQVLRISFEPLGEVVWEILDVDISNAETEMTIMEEVKKKVERIINKIGKERRLILRIIFQGLILIDKPIYQDLDYWRNLLYCFLSDRFDQQIYIEKVIDKSIEKKKATNKQINEFLEYILKSLNEPENKEFIQNYINEERDSLLSKLPKSVLNEIGSDKDENITDSTIDVTQ